MADDASRAFFPISHENHSAWVVVTAVVFLVYAIFGVVAKVVSKLQVSFMKLYDWLILGAITSAFVQTAFTIAACKHGLGQHRKAITAHQYATFSKVNNGTRLM